MGLWKIKDTLPQEISGSFYEELSTIRNLKATITRLVISECESCHENCHSLCMRRLGKVHHSKLQPRKAPTEMLSNSPTVVKTITPSLRDGTEGIYCTSPPKWIFCLNGFILQTIACFELYYFWVKGFYRSSFIHVINFHIFSSLYYLGSIQYLCHLQTTLSFNSHFHRHFWRAYSEIFRSFYECEECGGEPQDSPTYSSPFQLPAACQILINGKVARSYSCWFPLFLSGEFLSSIQSIEPALSPF